MLSTLNLLSKHWRFEQFSATRTSQYLVSRNVGCQVLMKLDNNPSHSWWWDSHHSPKQSRLLQSNLKVLDEKVKVMLKLIEEDADSFALRAEICYKKRPELANLVEEFYTALKSLSEQYDHLSREITKNIPSLQVQCGLIGLSCDSSGEFPFEMQQFNSHWRDQPGFERLLKKFVTGVSEKQTKSDDSEGVETSIGEHRQHGHSQELASSSNSDVDNSTDVEKLQQAYESLEEENRKLADRCRLSEAENELLQARLKEVEEKLTKLQQEKVEWQTNVEEKATLEDRLRELGNEFTGLQMENAKLLTKSLAHGMQSKVLEEELSVLKEERKFLEEAASQHLETERQLSRELEVLRIEDVKLKAVVLDRDNLVRALEDKIRIVQGQNRKLAAEVSLAVEQGKITMTALRFLKGEVSSLVTRNNKLREEVLHKADDATSKVKEGELVGLHDENVTLKNELHNFRRSEEKRVDDLNNKITELHGQVDFLREENRKQKLDILDRAEEKREAIRQLCFSMDVLKQENQQLEAALSSANARLHSLQNAASSGHLPAWKKALMSVWNGPKS